jgi:alkylation response protein AidB-like acyl-CoA dehydrogenase
VSLAAAQTLADQLRADAADRDRANQHPKREIELLKASGLLALSPDDHVTVHAATRIVSTADPSLGHLLGYHHAHLWRSAMYGNPELAAWMRAETVRRQWFWAGISNPPNPLDPALSLSRVDGGFVVNGRRVFCTGAAVADRIVAGGIREDDGTSLAFVVAGDAPGISHPPDWDNIGQRQSASGSVVFDQVRISDRDVLGATPGRNRDPDAAPTGESLRLSLAALAFQAILTQVYVGIAEGALAEAAGYTRERTRPWLLSGLERATDDPYILAGYGELAAEVRAAGLLADRASAELQQVSDRGVALSEEQRGEAGVTISMAKVVATKVANETTSRIFEFVGARGTASKYGLDRFWRNARTLTLHDPVSYKAREVGAHFLTGELPKPSAYS